MDLDEQIISFLSEADARPPRSKLEAYAGLIRELRQRRWTYRKIATALAERFGVTASPSTIHDFLRVRAHQPNSTKPEAITMPSPSKTNPPASLKRRFHLEM
jgi:transposase